MSGKKNVAHSRTFDSALKIAGVALLIGIWQFLTRYLPPSRLPTPASVLVELYEGLFKSVWISMRGGGNNGLWPHLLFSLWRWFCGTILGSALGIGMGLLIGGNRHVRDFFEPPLEFLRSVPPLAAVPFFIVWFGLGSITQLLVIVYFAFMRIMIFIVEAINNVSEVQKQFALTLGASRRQLFKTVVLPAVFPELVGGLRVVMASSWGIVVVAEMMGAHNGIGRVFNILITVLATKSIIAAIIWVTVIASATDALFVLIAGRWTKWVPEQK